MQMTKFYLFSFLLSLFSTFRSFSLEKRILAAFYDYLNKAIYKDVDHIVINHLLY